MRILRTDYDILDPVKHPPGSGYIPTDRVLELTKDQAPPQSQVSDCVKDRKNEDISFPPTAFESAGCGKSWRLLHSVQEVI